MLEILGSECRIAATNIVRSISRRSSSALPETAHHETNFRPTKIASAILGLVPNTRTTTVNAPSGSFKPVIPQNIGIEHQERLTHLIKNTTSSLQLDANCFSKFRQTGPASPYHLLFLRLEYITCLFFESFQLGEVKKNIINKDPTNKRTIPLPRPEQTGFKKDMLVKTASVPAFPNKSVIHLSDEWAAPMRFHLIQFVARSIVGSLQLARKINYFESEICLCVINNIEETELMPFTSDLKKVAFIFTVIFSQKLFSSLPLFLPPLYKYINGAYSEFNRQACTKMGVPNAKLHLTKDLDIVLCTTSEQRRTKIRGSVNALRFAMSKLKIRATLPWLFEGQTPDYFYKKNIFEVLNEYGFSVVSDSEVKPYDLVVYLNRGQVVHYGVSVVSGGNVVQSKWERTTPMEHDINALPIKYISESSRILFFRHETRFIEKKILSIVKEGISRIIDELSTVSILNHIAAECSLILEVPIINTIMKNSSSLYSSNYYSNLSNRLGTDLCALIEESEGGIVFSLLLKKLNNLKDEIESGVYFSKDFITPEHKEKVTNLFSSKEVL